jgi:hypothetical protein
MTDGRLALPERLGQVAGAHLTGFSVRQQGDQPQSDRVPEGRELPGQRGRARFGQDLGGQGRAARNALRGLGLVEHGKQLGHRSSG